MHPWRAAALYSFALYLVASLFLVLLPLPDLPARRAEPAAWEAQFGRLRTPELDPTASIRAAVTGAAGLRAVFQVLVNLALLAPLGVYFRWLFGLRAWTSALAGFVVSLAFGIDFFGFASSVLCLVEVADLLGLHFIAALYLGPAVLFLVWFVALPAVTDGRGVGKRLMLCAIARCDGGPAGRGAIAVRQGALWVVPALIWLSSGWFAGEVLGPTPLGWAVAAWCAAWAVNAASVIPSHERASLLDHALRLRVRNTW